MKKKDRDNVLSEQKACSLITEICSPADNRNPFSACEQISVHAENGFKFPRLSSLIRNSKTLKNNKTPLKNERSEKE